MVTHNSKSDLPLAAQLDSVGQTEMMATKSISESSGSSKKGCGSFPSVCPGFCYLFGLLTRNNDGAAATVVILRPVSRHFNFGWHQDFISCAFFTQNLVIAPLAL